MSIYEQVEAPNIQKLYASSNPQKTLLSHKGCIQVSARRAVVLGPNIEIRMLIHTKHVEEKTIEHIDV